MHASIATLLPVLFVLCGAAALTSCGEGASSDAMARVPDATGTPEQDATGARPQAREAAGGTVWVLGKFDRSVSVIEGETARLVQRVALGPEAITSGLVQWDGSVWVSDLAGVLHKIDVAKRELMVSVPLDDVIPVGLGAAQHGLYTVDPQTGTVARHDMRTGALQADLGRVDGPEVMAVGPGAAWVVGARRTQLHVFDAGATRSRVVRIALELPGNMAFGFGSLWYYQSNGRLIRVDPASGAVQATIDTPEAAFATGITVGSEAVWVCAPDARQIVRIDPASNHVAKRIEVAGMPLQLVELGNALWVVLTHDNAVIRIDPATGAETARCSVEQPTKIIAVR
jgi:streptogramin lyase